MDDITDRSKKLDVVNTLIKNNVNNKANKINQKRNNFTPSINAMDFNHPPPPQKFQAQYPNQYSKKYQNQYQI